MYGLTSASRSNRANSSFSIFTKSCALYVDEIAVKPTMSAQRILKQNDEVIRGRTSTLHNYIVANWTEVHMQDTLTERTLRNQKDIRHLFVVNNNRQMFRAYTRLGRNHLNIRYGHVLYEGVQVWQDSSLNCSMGDFNHGRKDQWSHSVTLSTCHFTSESLYLKPFSSTWKY